MFITGMEYPGLVFVSDHRLATDEGYVTLLHEIAHQWFYNVIGNDQINEPWLDEGMATYFTDEFLQQEKLDVYYAEISAYFQLQQLHYKPASEYEDWSTYWRSQYRKASFMIYDLKKQLGEDQFQQFLYEYYDTYQYDIVDGEQFKALVEKYLGETAVDFFSKWEL